MLIPFTHNVVYELQHRPDAEVIAASIISNRRLLMEAAAVLEGTLPGLVIDGVKVEVRQITQESPLREAFFAALIVAFQPKLEGDVPRIIEGLTGLHVPDQYQSLLSLMVCVVAFYGTAMAIDAIGGTADRQVKKRLGES